MRNDLPRLFGINNSNRDFTHPKSWGKNIFNNAFPVSLAAYMESQNIPLVYLKYSVNGQIVKDYISTTTFFGLPPNSTNIFYSFESDFIPYQSLVIGNLPRTDMVTIDTETDQCRSDLEIKLTALPDNSTIHLSPAMYGCEIVVRPDTIVYLALSIAREFMTDRNKLQAILQNLPKIQDWTNIAEISPLIPEIAEVMESLIKDLEAFQKPLVLQAVWKTEGKQLRLHEDAFDIFVWSNLAFTRLFFRDVERNQNKPSRGARSIVWLTKMVVDFAQNGKINHKSVIDQISYNTKNDKAFAVNGKVTQPFMMSDELITPRIKRGQVKDIILGGGENFLSPERRLDAAILSTPNLFIEG